jgi:hypothetical protein
MRKRCVGCVAAVLAAISMVGPATASAASEFGDGCVANVAEENFSLFQLASPSSGLPTASPATGVITQWRINLIPEVPFAVPQVLKVFRVTAPNTVQAVGESSPQQVVGGSNTFNVRVPIQVGDRLGLFGPSPIGTLFCGTGDSADVSGVVTGSAPLGSSNPFVSEEEVRVPAIAVVEPDADNDGFGDETQDKCPQNAALQIPCPVVALSTSASARKGLANVLVTSSFQAPVTVAGTVNLGKGKKAKVSGGTQIVTPGVIAKFTLLFPQKLKAKLKQLPRKQFLWLNVTSTAPNVVGPPTTSNLKVKLKGQAKPKPKPKKPRQVKS